ncbi:MAG TPA: rhamnulokinase family protein [Bacillota bacterium]|nr:rhamnulokinase family protein [Bacillota bacterium]
MNYLAFDLGASSGKMYLGRWDGAKLALETVHRFDNAAVPLAGGLYWDFIGIFQAMNLGVQKAAALTGNRLASLGIDTFANDFSLISRAGDLLAPVRCYRDDRTLHHREAIFSRMSPRQVYQATGNQISRFSTLMQLAAMREEGQGYLLDHAYKLLFLPDLLSYYITGEVIAEFTISSVSQLYDFLAGDWSEEVLAAYRIPRELLGEIVPPGTVAGSTLKSYRERYGVGPFSVIAVCEHDTASAFLASPLEGDGAIISSGTWSLVGTLVDQPVINTIGFAHNIANEGGYGGRVRLIRNLMGTWLIQELRTDFRRQGRDYSFEELSAMAAQAAPFAYIIDVDDELFYAPGDMAAKIRQRCRERLGRAPENAGELVRCVCESLALKTRWAVEKLEQFTGKALPVISIVGGGAQDQLLCQFMASACGRPVMAGPIEAAALGNILVQMIAGGQLKNIEQGQELIRRTFPLVHYQPRDTDRWAEAYRLFQSIYQLE